MLRIATEIRSSIGQQVSQRRGPKCQVSILKMCYYERDDYLCGDWKWGNMRQRCERQPRTGETCGAKLVAEEYRHRRNEDCRVCRDILTKRGRLQREQANIARWKKDGRKFEASIEKAERESRQLEDILRELYQRRPSYQLSKGGQGPRHGKFDRTERMWER